MNNTVFPFADADHAHLDVVEGMSGVSDDAFPSSSSSSDDGGGLELVESDEDVDVQQSHPYQNLSAHPNRATYVSVLRSMKVCYSPTTSFLPASPMYVEVPYFLTGFAILAFARQ